MRVARPPRTRYRVGGRRREGADMACLRRGRFGWTGAPWRHEDELA